MREGWTERTLGEVADVVAGGTPSTKVAEYWGGELIWITPTEVAAREGRVIVDSERKITTEGLRASSATLLPVDTVLLTSRATIGAVALSGVELSTNQGFASLVANESIVPRFLMYWCQSNKSEFESRAAGNTFKEISRKNVAEISIQVPPIEDQRRIVDVIETVDANIAALEKQADAARTARSALLHDLLSNPGPDWVETTLGGVAEWYSGGTPKAGKSEFYSEGTVEWAVIADMSVSHIFETDTKITEAGLSQIGGRLAPERSVLISMYATVGRAAMAMVPMATNQAIAWSIPDKSRVTPEFLLLTAQYLEPEIASQARGATQKNINREMLRGFQIWLPPIDTQRDITGVIGSVDALIDATDMRLTHYVALRAALLSDLLSGKHEIPESYDCMLGAA